jgi:hypothetical protein
MSVNTLGKMLVLVHLVLSMFAMTWAASVFLQFTDWGWKEPRKDLDQRVPSEYDKRAAALKEALRARDMVYGPVKLTQATLREAEERFPLNHLWYEKELARLQNDPDPIEVKEIEYEKGVLKLDTPGKLIGKPVLENPVPAIQKSYAMYLEDLKKLQKEADAVTADIRSWVEKTKTITFNLNGLDDDGKKVKKGLYDLLDIESLAHSQIKYEMEYLQPKWVDALKEAETYRERRKRLEEALLDVKPGKKK